MAKLRNIVKEIAKERKQDVTGGLDGRLRNWDRDLDRGKLTPEQAVGNVKREFKYNFTGDDYKKIEDEIKK